MVHCPVRLHVLKSWKRYLKENFGHPPFLISIKSVPGIGHPLPNPPTVNEKWRAYETASADKLTVALNDPSPSPLLSSRPERRIRPRIPRCNSRGIDPLRVYSDVAPAVSRSAGNVAQQVNCRAPAALSPSPLPPIRSPNSRRWFARPIFPAVESRRFAFSRRSDADTRRLTSLSSPLLSFSVGEFALRLRARLKKRRGGGGEREEDSPFLERCENWKEGSSHLLRWFLRLFIWSTRVRWGGILFFFLFFLLGWNSGKV